MKKYYHIELLRFLCALTVAIYHWGISFELMNMETNDTFSNLLNVLYEYGDKAVPVFFVISGFVITKSIIRNIQNNKFSFLEFYFKRIKRILPVVYHMLVLHKNFLCFQKLNMVNKNKILNL